MRHALLRFAVFVGVATSLTPPGAAQGSTSGSDITLTLRWTEATGNANGILEPGESALLWIDVSFTNQNTIANFQPSIGGFNSGTIHGLGSGFIDLDGSGGAAGTWMVSQAAGYGVAARWDVTHGFGNGEPVNGGATLLNLQFGQFANSPPRIMPDNPILAVWRGVWTSASYVARTVTFALTDNVTSSPPTSLIFELSPTAVAAIYLLPGRTHFGQVHIPIVPGPSSLAGIGLSILLGLHGRRPRGAS